MNWVAFFSQTGSEIAHVSERVGRWPNLIVTNRQDGFEKINQKLFSGKSRILFTEKKPDVQRYKEAIRSDSIVTLHGWLRIVPEEICGKYEIYNLRVRILKRELITTNIKQQVALYIEWYLRLMQEKS